MNIFFHPISDQLRNAICSANLTARSSPKLPRVLCKDPQSLYCMNDCRDFALTGVWRPKILCNPHRLSFRAPDIIHGNFFTSHNLHYSATNQCRSAWSERHSTKHKSQNRSTRQRLINVFPNEGRTSEIRKHYSQTLTDEKIINQPERVWPVLTAVSCVYIATILPIWFHTKFDLVH